MMTVLGLFDLPRGEISTVRLADTNRDIREVCTSSLDAHFNLNFGTDILITRNLQNV